ncbi:MAG: adenylate/guanylate cyclase domain-containing protein, partial [Deltaproteobacteria bacterium]|nr:adenylate/guanylate cyclase domain-containing protein [Deltaproteobacteria bacterium]
MLKNPDQLKLGGDEKDLSVLFSDIRGFTTISEGLTPEDLVRLLNEYLTVMTDIVFNHDGTLDKYMGDAIM